MQMLCAAVVAAGINKARGHTCFGGLRLKDWATKVVPVASAFAIYLYLSNLAYDYLDVCLIQMLKPVNGLLLFVVTFASGLEGATLVKTLNAVIILGAVGIIALDKVFNAEAGSANALGVAIVLGSAVAATAYQIGLQCLMQRQGPAEAKHLALDAVTCLAVVVPTSALNFLEFHENSKSIDWQIRDEKMRVF